MGREQPGEAPFFERVDHMKWLGRGISGERDELARLVEASQCVGEPVRRIAQLGGALIRGELPSRREEAVDDGRRDRPEDEQQRALEPTAEPAQLEQGCGDNRGRRLDQDVALLRVGKLVGQDAVELGRGECRKQPRADDDGLPPTPTTCGERTRKAVRDQVETRPRDTGPGGKSVHGRGQRRPFGIGKRTRADEAQDHPVRVPIHGGAGEQSTEDEDRQQPIPAEHPAEPAEQRAGAREQQPDLEDVERGRRGQFSSSRSSSAKPRGGQSGSGASQRLVQCSEAMF